MPCSSICGEPGVVQGERCRGTVPEATGAFLSGAAGLQALPANALSLPVQARARRRAERQPAAKMSPRSRPWKERSLAGLLAPCRKAGSGRSRSARAWRSGRCGPGCATRCRFRGTRPSPARSPLGNIAPWSSTSCSAIVSSSKRTRNTVPSEETTVAGSSVARTACGKASITRDSGIKSTVFGEADAGAAGRHIDGFAADGAYLRQPGLGRGEGHSISGSAFRPADGPSPASQY